MPPKADPSSSAGKAKSDAGGGGGKQPTSPASTTSSSTNSTTAATTKESKAESKGSAPSTPTPTSATAVKTGSQEKNLSSSSSKSKDESESGAAATNSSTAQSDAAAAASDAAADRPGDADGDDNVGGNEEVAEQGKQQAATQGKSSTASSTAADAAKAAAAKKSYTPAESTRNKSRDDDFIPSKPEVVQYLEQYFPSLAEHLTRMVYRQGWVTISIDELCTEMFDDAVSIVDTLQRDLNPMLVDTSIDNALLVILQSSEKNNVEQIVAVMHNLFSTVDRFRACLSTDQYEMCVHNAEGQLRRSVQRRPMHNTFQRSSSGAGPVSQNSSMRTSITSPYSSMPPGSPSANLNASNRSGLDMREGGISAERFSISGAYRSGAGPSNTLDTTSVSMREPQSTVSVGVGGSIRGGAGEVTLTPSYTPVEESSVRSMNAMNSGLGAGAATPTGGMVYTSSANPSAGPQPSSTPNSISGMSNTGPAAVGGVGAAAALSQSGNGSQNSMRHIRPPHHSHHIAFNVAAAASAPPFHHQQQQQQPQPQQLSQQQQGVMAHQAIPSHGQLQQPISHLLHHQQHSAPLTQVVVGNVRPPSSNAMSSAQQTPNPQQTTSVADAAAAAAGIHKQHQPLAPHFHHNIPGPVLNQHLVGKRPPVPVVGATNPHHQQQQQMGHTQVNVQLDQGKQMSPPLPRPQVSAPPQGGYQAPPSQVYMGAPQLMIHKSQPPQQQLQQQQQQQVMQPGQVINVANGPHVHQVQLNASPVPSSASSQQQSQQPQPQQQIHQVPAVQLPFHHHHHSTISLPHHMHNPAAASGRTGVTVNQQTVVQLGTPSPTLHPANPATLQLQQSTMQSAARIQSSPLQGPTVMMRGGAGANTYVDPNRTDSFNSMVRSSPPPQQQQQQQQPLMQQQQQQQRYTTVGSPPQQHQLPPSSYPQSPPPQVGSLNSSPYPQHHGMQMQPQPQHQQQQTVSVGTIPQGSNALSPLPPWHHQLVKASIPHHAHMHTHMHAHVQQQQQQQSAVPPSHLPQQQQVKTGMIPTGSPGGVVTQQPTVLVDQQGNRQSPGTQYVPAQGPLSPGTPGSNAGMNFQHASPPSLNSTPLVPPSSGFVSVPPPKNVAPVPLTTSNSASGFQSSRSPVTVGNRDAPQPPTAPAAPATANAANSAYKTPIQVIPQSASARPQMQEQPQRQQASPPQQPTPAQAPAQPQATKAQAASPPGSIPSTPALTFARPPIHHHVIHHHNINLMLQKNASATAPPPPQVNRGSATQAPVVGSAPADESKAHAPQANLASNGSGSQYPSQQVAAAAASVPAAAPAQSSSPPLGPQAASSSATSSVKGATILSASSSLTDSKSRLESSFPVPRHRHHLPQLQLAQSNSSSSIPHHAHHLHQNQHMPYVQHAGNAPSSIDALGDDIPLQQQQQRAPTGSRRSADENNSGTLESILQQNRIPDDVIGNLQASKVTLTELRQLDQKQFNDRLLGARVSPKWSAEIWKLIRMRTVSTENSGDQILKVLHNITFSGSSQPEMRSPSETEMNARVGTTTIVGSQQGINVPPPRTAHGRQQQQYIPQQQQQGGGGGGQQQREHSVVSLVLSGNSVAQSSRIESEIAEYGVIVESRRTLAAAVGVSAQRQDSELLVVKVRDYAKELLQKREFAQCIVEDYRFESDEADETSLSSSMKQDLDRNRQHSSQTGSSMSRSGPRRRGGAGGGDTGSARDGDTNSSMAGTEDDRPRRVGGGGGGGLKRHSNSHTNSGGGGSGGGGGGSMNRRYPTRGGHHGRDEENVICRFYRNNECSRGADCKYLHTD